MALCLIMFCSQVGTISGSNFIAALIFSNCPLLLSIDSALLFGKCEEQDTVALLFIVVICRCGLRWILFISKKLIPEAAEYNSKCLKSFIIAYNTVRILQ